MPFYFEDDIDLFVLSWSLDALLTIDVFPAARNLAIQRHPCGFIAFVTTWHRSDFPMNSDRDKLGLLAPFWLLAQLVRLRESTWTVVGSITGSQAVAYRVYEYSGYALAR